MNPRQLHAFVGLGLALALMLSGCVSLGREPGYRARERLRVSMTRQEAVSALAEAATIQSTSELTRGPDGKWIAAPGSKYATASRYGADASVAKVEARTKKRVVRMVLLDRTWGWMGLDVFLLYFDGDDRLVASDMIHLD